MSSSAKVGRVEGISHRKLGFIIKKDVKKKAPQSGAGLS
jgi:hypothetical protein